MRRRIVDKIYKRATDKVLAGEPRTQMETIVFHKVMERYLGDEIVRRIKTLGK
jgi:hypothetical protein